MAETQTFPVLEVADLQPVSDLESQKPTGDTKSTRPRKVGVEATSLLVEAPEPFSEARLSPMHVNDGSWSPVETPGATPLKPVSSHGYNVSPPPVATEPDVEYSW